MNTARLADRQSSIIHTYTPDSAVHSAITQTSVSVNQPKVQRQQQRQQHSSKELKKGYPGEFPRQTRGRKIKDGRAEVPRGRPGTVSQPRLTSKPWPGEYSARNPPLRNTPCPVHRHTRSLRILIKRPRLTALALLLWRGSDIGVFRRAQTERRLNSVATLILWREFFSNPDIRKKCSLVKGYFSE